MSGQITTCEKCCVKKIFSFSFKLLSNYNAKNARKLKSEKNKSLIFRAFFAHILHINIPFSPCDVVHNFSFISLAPTFQDRRSPGASVSLRQGAVAVENSSSSVLLDQLPNPNARKKSLQKQTKSHLNTNTDSIIASFFPPDNNAAIHDKSGVQRLSKALCLIAADVLCELRGQQLAQARHFGATSSHIFSQNRLNSEGGNPSRSLLYVMRPHLAQVDSASVLAVLENLPPLRLQVAKSQHSYDTDLIRCFYAVRCAIHLVENLLFAMKKEATSLSSELNANPVTHLEIPTTANVNEDVNEEEDLNGGEKQDPAVLEKESEGPFPTNNISGMKGLSHSHQSMREDDDAMSCPDVQKSDTFSDPFDLDEEDPVERPSSAMDVAFLSQPQGPCAVVIDNCAGGVPTHKLKPSSAENIIFKKPRAVYTKGGSHQNMMQSHMKHRRQHGHQKKVHGHSSSDTYTGTATAGVRHNSSSSEKLLNELDHLLRSIERTHLKLNVFELITSLCFAKTHCLLSPSEASLQRGGTRSSDNSSSSSSENDDYLVPPAAIVSLLFLVRHHLQELCLYQGETEISFNNCSDKRSNSGSSTSFPPADIFHQRLRAKKLYSFIKEILWRFFIGLKDFFLFSRFQKHIYLGDSATTTIVATGDITSFFEESEEKMKSVLRNNKQVASTLRNTWKNAQQNDKTIHHGDVATQSGSLCTNWYQHWVASIGGAVLNYKRTFMLDDDMYENMQKSPTAHAVHEQSPNSEFYDELFLDPLVVCVDLVKKGESLKSDASDGQSGEHGLVDFLSSAIRSLTEEGEEEGNGGDRKEEEDKDKVQDDGERKEEEDKADKVQELVRKKVEDQKLQKRKKDVEKAEVEKASLTFKKKAEKTKRLSEAVDFLDDFALKKKEEEGENDKEVEKEEKVKKKERYNIRFPLS